MKPFLLIMTSALALGLNTPLAAAPRTQGQKQAQEIYQKSLRADALLAKGQYAETASVLVPLHEALAELVDADDEAAEYLLSIRPGDLPTVRLLGLDYTELAGTGTSEIRADRYVDILADVARMTRRVVETDDFTTDSQIAADAISVVREAKKPGKADPASLAVRLRLAVAQLQGVLTRNPGLATKTINEANPAVSLQEGRTALVSIDKKAQAAQASATTAMPEAARFVLDNRLEVLAGIQKALEADGFVPDTDFTRWLVDPQPALAELRAIMKKAYDDQGRSMPADAAQSAADRATALRALALKKAASFTFPPGQVDAGISAVVTGQLQKNVKGVKVLRVAMKGSEWGINRNDLGLIESRYRYGAVLYQMPGETWPRCSEFSYREAYDGKGYQKADGVAYTATRWQQPQ